MRSPGSTTTAIERADRLRSLGAWALGLGLAVGVLAVMTSGVLPPMGPKSTTSIHSALVASGYMRWLFVPMVAVSAGLIGVGLVLRAIARRTLPTDRAEDRTSE